MKESNCLPAPFVSPRLRCLAQLRAFAATHGRAPTARECGAGHKPRKRPELPYYNVLTGMFGSFRRALELAGLAPRPQGLRVDHAARSPLMIAVSGGRMATTFLMTVTDDAADRIGCPANRFHHPRMTHRRRHGVTTGELVAWCYECQREIPPATLPSQRAS